MTMFSCIYCCDPSSVSLVVLAFLGCSLCNLIMLLLLREVLLLRENVITWSPIRLSRRSNEAVQCAKSVKRFTRERFS